MPDSNITVIDEQGHLIAIASDLDHAFAWGKEDALEGKDQRGSLYFPFLSQAWHSYNDGYAAGCDIYVMLTGRPRFCWRPVVAV